MSPKTAHLIKLVREIMYGTIGPGLIDDIGSEFVSLDVTQAEFLLAKSVEEYREFSELIVHDGRPQYLNVIGEDIWPYVKKIKLS